MERMTDQQHPQFTGLPPRVLPRTFSYNTFTPTPSTPTLGESSTNPWRLSLPPTRSQTPDLTALNNAIVEAREEREELMKDEDRIEDGLSPGRWQDDEWSSSSGSEEGSTMSTGVGKVKAAQAVWYVYLQSGADDIGERLVNGFSFSGLFSLSQSEK